MFMVKNILKANLLILTLGISWQALAQSAALEPGIQELQAAQAQRTKTVPQSQQAQTRQQEILEMQQMQQQQDEDIRQEA
jgi:hypothetical protein